MATIEEKLKAVENRFRKASKQYNAARYIVRQNRKIPKDEQEKICQEIPMSHKSLEGVFTELRKMGLYPPLQYTPESAYQSRTKKKTETEKVSPLTDKGYSVIFDPALMGHYRRDGSISLEGILKSEESMLAYEYKSKIVEELNLNRRARIAKRQKEIDKPDKEYATKEDFKILRKSIEKLISTMSDLVRIQSRKRRRKISSREEDQGLAV